MGSRRPMFIKLDLVKIFRCRFALIKLLIKVKKVTILEAVSSSIEPASHALCLHIVKFTEVV